ncbi:hypothetical protein WK23_22005 [Burkholderia vietnamiensis]|nr:hypothetical protein WK23_22005 [Burkholderia vietnamiensis]
MLFRHNVNSRRRNHATIFYLYNTTRTELLFNQNKLNLYILFRINTLFAPHIHLIDELLIIYPLLIGDM